MNSRDRVLAAIAHQTADCLPIFSPNIMRTEEPYDKRLMAFLDSFEFDCLAIPGGLQNGPHKLKEIGGGESVDGYGCRFKYMGAGLPYCIHSPLATAETVADVDAMDWPDPEVKEAIAPDAAEKAKALHEEGLYATALNVPPLFHRYHYLRGFEQWMVDIKLSRSVHEAIANHVYHINSTLLMRSLDAVGPYIDIVSTGDDFGTTTASYMSPQDFRSLIKPSYKALIARIKGRFPHIKFYLHSHGQIMDLVPDLIECGVDILNPVLPLDNMDPVRLKREFGKYLCFHGGIDIEKIIPFGTVDEVRQHVKQVIDTLGKGGGYWFKLQVISPLIPTENIIVAYELAREYG